MKLAPHKIREAREAKEWTYSQLARELARHDFNRFASTSGGQIRRWEEGRHQIRGESDVITAIAAVTERRPEFFYLADDAKREEQESSDDEEDEDLLLALMDRWAQKRGYRLVQG